MTRAAAFLLVTLLSVPTPVVAQTPPPQAAVNTTPAPPGAAGAASTPDPIAPQGYAYDPQGRRDPFVSLLRRGTSAAEAGSRAIGLAGLGTAEVSLRGTMHSRGTYVGILRGADSRTYIVRAGDKLADGTIRSISADALVVLQQIDDPLSIEKQREVRKMLRQSEEAK